MRKDITKNNIFLFSYVSLLFFTLSPSFIYAQTPLFVFGDSIYDAGMSLYSEVKVSAAEFWPYGETFFKRPAGRFTDGRIIPDFIAQYAGLPFPVPYLQPGFNNYTNGASFASAGACVRSEARPLRINLKMQVKYFEEMIEKFKKQEGEAKAKKLIKNGVYMFNIGGNDYVTLLQNNVNKSLSPSYKNYYMSIVLGNLTDQITRIYSNGARKFAFQNVLPLGCLPSIKYRLLGFKGTCVEEALEFAMLHNSRFLEVAKKLQTELPGFKYSIYDIYTSCSKRVYHGERYGFTETEVACCGSGPYNGKLTCQDKNSGFNLCSNPNDHLWFDGPHPTDRANQQFAPQFWDGPSTVVYPYGLKSLFEMNDDDETDLALITDSASQIFEEKFGINLTF